MLEGRSLVIPDVKLIRTMRFSDDRGYSIETFQHAEFITEIYGVDSARGIDRPISASEADLSTTRVARPPSCRDEKWSPKIIQRLHSELRALVRPSQIASSEPDCRRGAALGKFVSTNI
jgi:hypothetical protein